MIMEYVLSIVIRIHFTSCVRPKVNDTNVVDGGAPRERLGVLRQLLRLPDLHRWTIVNCICISRYTIIIPIVDHRN